MNDKTDEINDAKVARRRYPNQFKPNMPLPVYQTPTQATLPDPPDQPQPIHQTHSPDPPDPLHPIYTHVTWLIVVIDSNDTNHWSVWSNDSLTVCDIVEITAHCGGLGVSSKQELHSS